MTGTVHPLRPLADLSRAPTLALVDLQKEQLATPRALAHEDPGEALGWARRALQRARDVGLPVAHLRTVARGPYFSRGTPFSEWIDGFEPLASEMVFERDRPSCYAAPMFVRVMDEAGGRLVLAGLSGELSILSTVVDAYHRGHSLTFLKDASDSHALPGRRSRDVHDYLCSLIALYASPIQTAFWLEGQNCFRNGEELVASDLSDRSG